MAVGCISGSIKLLQGWCNKFKRNAEIVVAMEKEYQVFLATMTSCVKATWRQYECNSIKSEDHVPQSCVPEIFML